MAKLLIYYNPNKCIYYFRYKAVLVDSIPPISPQGHILVSVFHIKTPHFKKPFKYRLANLLDILSNNLKK